ncbi:hypothetical protein BDZ88DRAFT_492278 [Geranomyces variabilis]|nr:hypothetical protein BDZ88DRAFT_492278 [Geranomyces variabilis]
MRAGNHSSTGPTSAMRAGKRPRTDNSTLMTEDRTYLANIDYSGDSNCIRPWRNTEKKLAILFVQFPDGRQGASLSETQRATISLPSHFTFRVSKSAKSKPAQMQVIDRTRRRPFKDAHANGDKYNDVGNDIGNLISAAPHLNPKQDSQLSAIETLRAAAATATRPFVVMKLPAALLLSSSIKDGWLSETLIAKKNKAWGRDAIELPADQQTTPVLLSDRLSCATRLLRIWRRIDEDHTRLRDSVASSMRHTQRMQQNDTSSLQGSAADWSLRAKHSSERFSIDSINEASTLAARCPPVGTTSPSSDTFTPDASRVLRKHIATEIEWPVEYEMRGLDYVCLEGPEAQRTGIYFAVRHTIRETKGALKANVLSANVTGLNVIVAESFLSFHGGYGSVLEDFLSVVCKYGCHAAKIRLPDMCCQKHLTAPRAAFNSIHDDVLDEILLGLAGLTFVW